VTDFGPNSHCYPKLDQDKVPVPLSHFAYPGLYGKIIMF